tara:strand:+ start:1808 stop:2806 length:999 start_codon:yes stop_codon:yes gene_type:complete
MQATLKQTILAPVSYPARAGIGDNAYEWDDPEYNPSAFTDKFILEKKPAWADHPHVPFLEILKRKTINGKGEIVELSTSKHYDFREGRFLNPLGKTGITGRGMLGRWGPNWAADVIITKEVSEKLWVLLCEKQVGDGDSVLCFPAGMVDEGEHVPQTLRRELCEEAVDDNSAVDELFDKCCIGCVYAGWVDDWRNTDNAWMVTQAYHFHATVEVASKLTLAVKDTTEIKKSAWYDVTTIDKMYASHKDWLDKVHGDYKSSKVENGGAFLSNGPPHVPFVSNDLPHGVKYPFVSHEASLAPKTPPPLSAGEETPIGKKRPRSADGDTGHSGDA